MFSENCNRGLIMALKFSRNLEIRFSSMVIEGEVLAVTLAYECFCFWLELEVNLIVDNIV